MILSLEPSAVDGGKRQAVVNAIRQTTDEDLRGAGLATGLIGVPIMQLEIRHAHERDPILYKAHAAWDDQLAPPNWMQGAIGNGPYRQLTL